MSHGVAQPREGEDLQWLLNRLTTRIEALERRPDGRAPPVSGVGGDDVTLVGTGSYLSLSGQELTQDLITESDITDLGSYLVNITGESVGDLSDVDLTGLADTNVLVYNLSTGNFEPGAGGGGAFLPLAGGTMTGQVLLPDGTFGAPALAMSGDATSGIFFETATGAVKISSGANVQITLGDHVLFRSFTANAPGDMALYDLMNVGDLTMGSAKQLLADDGTAALPSYAFASEAGLGMYRWAAGVIAFADTSVIYMRIGPTTYSDVRFSMTDGNAFIVDDDTSLTDAMLQFVGDPNTGIRYVSADAFSLLAGGADVIALTTAGITVTGNIAVTGTVDGRDVAADGTTLDAIPATYLGIAATAADSSLLGGSSLATVLARANHTGTQLHTTISDFDAGVRTNRLDQMALPTATVNMNSRLVSNILDPTLGIHAFDRAYADARFLAIAAQAADSALLGGSSLATVLARANHTGTQLHTTISDFDAGVQTNRLDQLADPTATVDMSDETLTNVKDPTNGAHSFDRNYADARYPAGAAGVITALTAVTPADADQLLIEDATDSDLPKRISISDLVTTPGSHAATHEQGGGDEVTQLASLQMGGQLDVNAKSLRNPQDPTLGIEIGDRDYNDGRYLSSSGNVIGQEVGYDQTTTTNQTITSSALTAITGVSFSFTFVSGEVYYAWAYLSLAPKVSNDRWNSFVLLDGAAAGAGEFGISRQNMSTGWMRVTHSGFVRISGQTGTKTVTIGVDQKVGSGDCVIYNDEHPAWCSLIRVA